MKKVSIIIVNWNGKDDTLLCLQSLSLMQTKGISITTIVVDNGSTDDSVKAITTKYPWVKIIAIGKNLGFTGGNNKGIAYALSKGADFVWFLNNDTVVGQDALCILDAFTSEDVGIVGSKIYFTSGKEYHKNRYAKKNLGNVLWYAGGLIDWDNMYASHRGVDEVDIGQYDTPEDTLYVTGCSFVIRRSLIEQVGMFDERYFLYLEDLDYCLRAKKAGFRILYYPSSVVWHSNAGSSGGPGNLLHEYYQTRNRLRIGWTYAPLRTKFALLREAGGFLLGGSSVKKKAVLDVLLGKWGKQYE